MNETTWNGVRLSCDKLLPLLLIELLFIVALAEVPGPNDLFVIWLLPQVLFAGALTALPVALPSAP